MADTPRPIDIGEKMPNIVMGSFYNYGTPMDSEKEPNKLSSFYKNRVLIIDFWGPYCSYCVASMRRTDSLRKIYKEDLEIIMVTESSGHTVDSFFKKRPDLRSLQIPMIIGDSLLGVKMFPHQGKPHVVWIDSKGTVFAITGGNYITAENIEAAISGRSFRFVRKVDSMNFDVAKELDRGNENNFIYRSILEKSDLSTPGAIYAEPIFPAHVLNPKVRRILVNKASIKELYLIAAFKRKYSIFNPYIYSMELSDSTRYINPMQHKEEFKKFGYDLLEDWMSDNMYTYELILPESVLYLAFYENMLSDLNRVFSVTGKMEYRPTPCYVIRQGSTVLMRTSGGESRFIHTPRKTKFDYFDGIQNKKISELVEMLNLNNLGKPIVDKTGIDYPVDLEISLNMMKPDIGEIRSELSKYGLLIEEEIIPFEVLVIKEKH
ncbi:hypothetical protein EGT74_00335 [Chitinophaga lutea]|uniref:Thioredoxin domain-containing protein n=2 Tax=Chitinophaga lutea TaxID=2488634 RepID=A0A3N4PYS6_9BACT|nr:hypothetical protein EGT74_00335 [Chitinophaga lutea]